MEQIKVGQKVQLECGLEGFVKESQREGCVSVHLENGDWFNYRGKVCIGGGECGNKSDYDFDDNSMDIRKIIEASNGIDI